MEKIDYAGIYEITSPTGKIYVGQSTQIYKRFNTYVKLRRNRIGTALYNSFLKYGVYNHQFKIVIVIASQYLRQALDGNEKDRIAYYRKKGVPLLNMTDGGAGSYGFKHSPEVIERLRELGSGKNSGMARAVMQYDLDGNYIQTFDTVVAAAKSCGVSEPSVSAALRGITHKAGGFKWKYKDPKYDTKRTSTGR